MKEYRKLKPGERVKLYNLAMRLRDRGLGYKRIAKRIEGEYGIRMNIWTVKNWTTRGDHPLGRCNKIVEGPELAYALGAWLGDGTLARYKGSNHNIIWLAVKDFDFAEEWGRCLATALGKSRPYKPRWSKSRQLWIVSGYSLPLYNLLREARREPRILLPYLEKYPGDACRGFFDAEGCVIIRNHEVKACNTDHRLIELFGLLLEKVGIQYTVYKSRDREAIISPGNGKIYCRKPLLILVIRGKDDIMRFAEEVGFTIARKRIKLMQILQKYQKIKIHEKCLESVARALIAANLVRLGLVKTWRKAAGMLSVHYNTVSNYLHRRMRVAKLLRLPEIEQLARKYAATKDDNLVKEVQDILRITIEIYRD